MRKELVAILLLRFVNVLNFTIMIPVLPFIVELYGGGPALYGLILATYPMFQFFAAPILGALSDRYGRRPILLLSQLGTLLSWIIFSLSYFVPEYRVGLLALPLIVIMISRITDGITGGNNSVAYAYLTDIAKPAERSKAFGLMGGITGLGLIIGPAIGGMTNASSIGYLGTGIATITISVITFVLMYLFLPESLKEENRNTSMQFKLADELKFVPKLMRYMSNRTFKYLFFIRIFLLLVFHAYVSMLVLFIIDQFGLDEQSVGYVFFVIGTFLIINQMFVAPYLASRIGNLKTFILGLFVFIATLVLMQFVPTLAIFFLVAYFLNFGVSVSFPTFKSLLSNNANNKQQGEVQGIDESLFAAASATAPIISGFIYSGIGKWSFSIYAVFLLIPLVVFVRRYREAN